MDDPPRLPATGDHGARYEDGPPRVPRWVTIAAIVAIMVVLSIVAVMLISGGAGHIPPPHGAGTAATGLGV
jgi:hypothetical protein